MDKWSTIYVNFKELIAVDIKTLTKIYVIILWYLMVYNILCKQESQEE